jgi:hypothetical protein
MATPGTRGQAGSRAVLARLPVRRQSKLNIKTVKKKRDKKKNKKKKIGENTKTKTENP